WRALAICVVLAAKLSEEQALKQACPSCGGHQLCNCSAIGLDFVPSGLTGKIIRLDLSHNKIQHIRSQDLRHAVNLRALLLQDNEIGSIDEDSFSSLGKLELLDLSNNSLAYLSPSWFGHLLSLQHLHLQGNFYRDLGEGSLFSGLQNLSSLHLGNSWFSTLRQGNFEGLEHLEELWIVGGKLSEYEPGSLKSVKRINHLIIDISHAAVFSAIVRDILHSVPWLDVRGIKLEIGKESLVQNSTLPYVMWKLTFRDAWFTDQYISRIIVLLKEITSLRELEAIDCVLEGKGAWDFREISRTGESFVETVSIVNVMIQNFHLFFDLDGMESQINKLKRLSIVSSKVFMVPCKLAQHFSSIVYLDFYNNLLVNNRLSETLCEGAWPSLQTLNLSRNSLKSLQQTVHSMSHLITLVNLDISQNNFGEIPDVCEWPKNLKHLNLSSTQIPRVTTCIPPTLEVLDVSANNLREFRLQLPSLKELFLAQNQLKTLPGAAPIPSLVVMSVRRNKLNSFSKEDLVVRGAQVGAVHLSLMECHRSLVVSLICVLVFLVILALVAVGHKYHAVWYLRMTWAWLQAKRKPKRALPKDVCYDAFVSYSENDSDWVENTMVRELEQACPPFRLCLHKRDFVPGKWIVDNIIDCIEKSHKTLFVLSEHFVQSEWCKYELDFSHFRLFDENNDAAVLVLLEPIQSKAIPKRFCKLRKVMNTKTYLEWPLEEEKQLMFWENLKGALRT
ncbi:TLR21 protein, partial [Rhinopomastus cyanomelas]|nr:TLR21 protein [Rhinopomastus cyanomelas]